MKMWRKQAMQEGKRDGRRPGRAIKQANQIQEYIFRNSVRTYPLLTALFNNAGIAADAPRMTAEVTDENEAQ